MRPSRVQGVSDFTDLCSILLGVTCFWCLCYAIYIYILVDLLLLR